MAKEWQEQFSISNLIYYSDIFCWCSGDFPPFLVKLQHVLKFPIWCTMRSFWTNCHFRLHSKCAIWQVVFSSWKQHNFLPIRFHSNTILKISQELFFPFSVRTFWEAHKIWKNLPHGLDIYLVNVQTMRKIFSNFMCFSESPNFNCSICSSFTLLDEKKLWKMIRKYIFKKKKLMIFFLSLGQLQHLLQFHNLMHHAMLLDELSLPITQLKENSVQIQSDYLGLP